MPYRKTLQRIADHITDEGLKALIVQLSSDLEAEFKATSAYNEALLSTLTDAINDFKMLTGDRYIRLDHKVDNFNTGFSSKIHNLANNVAVLQYKIDDLVELLTNNER